jgi:hypothetical protein
MDRSAHSALPSSFGAAVTHTAGLGGKSFIDVSLSFAGLKASVCSGS